jgi:hypothetical protein
LFTPPLFACLPARNDFFSKAGFGFKRPEINRAAFAQGSRGA